VRGFGWFQGPVAAAEMLKFGISIWGMCWCIQAHLGVFRWLCWAGGISEIVVSFETDDESKTVKPWIAIGYYSPGSQ
jgi:hypothetical protein